jgi:hypothetical protein
MKRLTSILTALLFCLLSLTCVAAQSTEAVEPFDPSGNFHPVQPPEAASDKFLQFNLRVPRKGGKLQAIGEVRGVQPWLKFSTKAIDERGMQFLTEVKNGVRYEFEGDFLEKGNYARRWSGDRMAPLKGEWRKSVRGEQVWEYATEFVYYPPH